PPPCLTKNQVPCGTILRTRTAVSGSSVTEFRSAVRTLPGADVVRTTSPSTTGHDGAGAIDVPSISTGAGLVIPPTSGFLGSWAQTLIARAPIAVRGYNRMI